MTIPSRDSNPPDSPDLQPVTPEEPPAMLDVDLPHEPIHGWRDFLLHIATITIGLLIAFEAGVEAILPTPQSANSIKPSPTK